MIVSPVCSVCPVCHGYGTVREPADSTSFAYTTKVCLTCMGDGEIGSDAIAMIHDVMARAEDGNL